MLQISVAQLYEANHEKLALAWVGSRAGDAALIRQDATESAAFVGHLNLIHPNRIQVLGLHEQAHLDALDHGRVKSLIERATGAAPAAILLADSAPGHPTLIEMAEARGIALLSSPMPAAFLIDKLRRHLSKVLAESTTRHGVFMDVLGLGVLITGDSGVGKSELGLELISRGHGLVADDVVVLESGGVETRDEYRSHHLPADIQFARAVPSTRGATRVVTRGDVAWARSTSRTRGEFRGRSIDSVGAELMVLVRTADGWRIAAIHWSSRSR